MKVSYEDMKCVIRISLIFITNGIYKKCGLNKFGKIHFPKRGAGEYERRVKTITNYLFLTLHSIQICRAFSISDQTMGCYFAINLE